MDDWADTAAPTIDSARFRQVLGHFCSGIVIVTGMDGDEAVGLTCQSFSSVSLDPPLILFCPATTSSSWPRIRNSGAFAVNILSSEQEDVCRLFARSEEHTSELQSHVNLVCRLLLEKKTDIIEVFY